MRTWQIELLTNNTAIVCMDATHNTVRNVNDKRFYLKTIVAKSSVIGKGVTLAWMVTGTFLCRVTPLAEGRPRPLPTGYHDGQ
ncbi:uncharacterized protein BYT42DRAFT_616667 [Radiomyces spectabilis]|uniref:uncharacterized protein n=1 Tax=Radiomyces spectabilis TaxID=64574 RepID=UPI00221E7AF3|nr:uncharacterized protein BYT42DRAFT_616667 [Radiomyces spectabilis]KAI8371585.1 hypothetical protein BYT42DRAFT_616667 [Radiomyces spectabilis]